MDEDTLVLAEITLRLIFDEDDGELLHVEVDPDKSPTVVQALGMLHLAADTFLNGDADDDE